MPEPALALEGVTGGYHGRPVVEDVTLSVGPGEVVGLIGPNGSGKTTLVRMASRALPPWSGVIRIAGRDPYALPSREAARLVAVVPQEMAPTFSFSALEIVLMGRSSYLSRWGGGGPGDFARTREAMESAHVHHLADRMLEELSGGEKQRVVLAQALAQDAPVLLLDEPTTHLDVKHVVGILDTVRGLARDRRTAVLAIFHDLNLAAAYCDRVVALSRGRVAGEGLPEQVITRDLLGRVYGVEGEVTPHVATGRPTVHLGPGAVPSPTRGLPRGHVVGGAGRGAPVMRILVERGYEVTAGVLHASDTDEVVAERMNLARVSVPPFSVVDEEAEEEAVTMMREAELVVVCDAPYGPGNVGNLRGALRAAEEGIRVLVVEGIPIRERDFTGGEAAALWARLAARGRVVGSYEDLAELLERTPG